MITIPQIRSTAISFAAIVFVAFSFSVFNGLRHGEARTLSNWAEICIDAANYGALIGFGWIALKSPLAKEVSGLLTRETTKETTEPSGKTVIEKTKTVVSTESTELPKGN